MRNSRLKPSRRGPLEFSRGFVEALEARRLLSGAGVATAAGRIPAPFALAVVKPAAVSLAAAASPAMAAPDLFPGATYHAAGAGDYATGHAGHAVGWIVIHTTESTAASTINEFTTPNIQVSANYLVERNGTIDQFVSNNNTAYHAGNLAYNESSIGIEHERYTTGSTQFNTTEQEYEASAELVRWLSSYYNIPLVHLAAAVAPASPSSGSDIIGHYQVPDPNNPTLGGGASHHTDPVNWDWTHYTDLLNTTSTPLMPVLIGPGTITPGATTLASTSQTLSWMPAANATSYKITLTDTTANSTATFTPGGTATTQAVSLVNGHSYTWSMMSLNGTVQSIASPTYAFAVSPSSVPALVGRHEAENYDAGGEGVAYHDTEPANLGGKYRTDGVDIETTTDTGGGFDVGYAHAGEYLRYTMQAASAGMYTLSLRAANVGAGATLHVEVDGVNVTGSIAIPNTGGFQQFVDVNAGTHSLTAGTHVIKIMFDANAPSGYAGNLNWFSFQPSAGTGEGPFNGTPANLPGTVQGENYDTGGEGVAFHDTTTANEGGQYRTDGVDIETAPGGFAVDYTHAGEWLKYTVNITAARTYTFDAKVANYGVGAAFHVEVDGVNVTGSMPVPDTRSFTSYTDVLRTGIPLTAGQHVVRVMWDANSQFGFAGNLDSFRFA